MNMPMNSPMILWTIQSKNYYYVQGLGGNNSTTVILADNKKQALILGEKWQQEKGFKELYLYRNNYKPECRMMLAKGNYIK